VTGAHALSDSFFSTWRGAARGARSGPDPSLEAALGAAAAAASAAWPRHPRSAESFAAYVGARVDPELDPRAAVESVRAADLWIAAACVDGDAAAIAAVEAHYFGAMRATLAKQGIAPDKVDEVEQGLRKLLFVGDGGPPRIGEYRGAGDLKAWLRVTATRAALKLVRAQSRETPAGSGDDALFEARAPSDDPELAYIKAAYRAEFKSAFQEALDSLSARERLLLKQQIVDGLNVDELGRLYAVHRATAARWTQAARDKLLTRTRRVFILRARITGDECDSVMRLVKSQLDVSLQRRLTEGL
jgi:RNA polymerase sigma-70 factor, ECF subfamily